MIRINQRVAIDESEISFTFSRSSGPGGQNVNKVATRVTLLFKPADSRSLTELQRERVLHLLGPRLDKRGTLRIVASGHRSQSANREEAVHRFVTLLSIALRPRRTRRPTKPSAASRERRLTEKRHRSGRKSSRKGIRPGDES